MKAEFLDSEGKSQNCSSCSAHLKADDVPGDVKLVFCRHLPPVVVINPTNGYPESHMPRMLSTGWCRQWEEGKGPDFPGPEFAPKEDPNVPATANETIAAPETIQ